MKQRVCVWFEGLRACVARVSQSITSVSDIIMCAHSWWQQRIFHPKIRLRQGDKFKVDYLFAVRLPMVGERCESGAANFTHNGASGEYALDEERRDSSLCCVHVKGEGFLCIASS